jgi:hypothetical protein
MLQEITGMRKTIIVIPIIAGILAAVLEGVGVYSTHIVQKAYAAVCAASAKSQWKHWCYSWCELHGM